VNQSIDRPVNSLLMAKPRPSNTEGSWADIIIVSHRLIAQVCTKDPRNVVGTIHQNGYKRPDTKAYCISPGSCDLLRIIPCSDDDHRGGGGSAPTYSPCAGS